MIERFVDTSGWAELADRTLLFHAQAVAAFVVMQQRGLTEALTTDHHFEQAGYVRLLK
jgi:predicted nucleic acid-binding protein